MKHNHSHLSKPARFFVTVMSLVAGLGSYGAVVTPAVAATTPVSVDQQPLNIPPPIPPNIVLMLDDSGSMNANFMPDWSYLKNNGQYQAVIDASNNGVYYNPAVTYLSPPHADDTTYPSQTDMTVVPVDGFGAMTTQTVNLFTYAGEWECGDASNCGNGTSTSNNKIQFNTSVVSATTATYSATTASGSDCTNVFDSYPNGVPGSLVFNNGVSTIGSGNCTFQYYPANHYFQYSIGPATGPYTVYYVAPASQGCGSQPNCVLDSAIGDGTNGAPAPGTYGAPAGGVTVGQNIANWFAYYHTRLLMAKSGLMTAFSTLDPKFRLGFGSINNKNVSGLPSPTYSASHTIADVAVFGAPTDATSQRINFWNWTAGEKADGTTPLRAALATVGSYYQTAQPWTNMASDPQFSDTNPYNASSPGSPLQCRQAYTILTTDGFWNGNYSSTTIAGASGTAGPTFTPPLGANPSYTGYTPADPFQGGETDDGSPSLADVAMYYWNHDLQASLNNELVNSSQDPAYWQHMVTFTLGLGFAPNYSDQTTPIPMDQVFAWAQGGAPVANWPGWPTPSAANNGSINNIADLAHAGVNGHGGFFSATSPQSLVNGLEAALGSVGQRSGTGASLGANSTKLQTDTIVYQAKYSNSSADRWTGDLLALALNPSDGAVAQYCPPSSKSPQPCWSAATVLQGMGTSSSGSSVVTYPDRDIQTFNPQGATYAAQFIAFKNATTTTTNPDGTTSTATTPPALSSTQLGNLGSDAGAQTNMVNYLRGDNTLEKKNNVGSFRNRSTPLGDIVDSQPIYDGAPDATEFNGQSFYGLAYQTDSSGTTASPFYDFVSNEASRAGMIYVAANDGMLHVFDASTGKEVFAYLPGALLVNQTDPATGIQEPLSNLSNPDYGGATVPHQYYNDGQVTVADTYVTLAQEGETSPSWHTILVGTTGRGPARAVYAIDVTDPTKITPLWERSAGDTVDSNSGYIGEVTGKPIIAQTNATGTSSTWSVVMGNGYNSPNGVAAMLQFNLATGALSAYTTSDTISGSGLAGVFTWMDNPTDGVTDLAYAGDLRGNVYQFTLNDSTGANPSNASSATSKYTTLLFTATDAGGARQPITTQVTAAKNPTDGNLWLFFGTGKYLTSTDASDKSVQTWYGIIVTPGSTQVSTLKNNLSNERNVLVQRSILAEVAGSNPPPPLPARVVTPMPSTPDITCSSTSKCKAGWYMDLVSPTANGGTLAQGERMVYPDSLQGGLLVGTTIIPQPANQSTDPCSPQGSGWIMAVDPFTGTNPAQNFFDINGNGTIDGGDYLNYGGKQVAAAGVGFGDLPNAPIFVGGVAEVPLGSGTVVHVATRGGSGSYQRVSWRELVN